jgi:hypothetical protein
VGRNYNVLALVADVTILWYISIENYSGTSCRVGG